MQWQNVLSFTLHALDWFHNEHTIVCIPQWIPKHIWGIIIQWKMGQENGEISKRNSLKQRAQTLKFWYKVNLIYD